MFCLAEVLLIYLGGNLPVFAHIEEEKMSVSHHCWLRSNIWVIPSRIWSSDLDLSPHKECCKNPASADLYEIDFPLRVVQQ